jgi:hypothetical protein
MGAADRRSPGTKPPPDFFNAMNAEYHRYAIRGLHARHSSFHTRS